MSFGGGRYAVNTKRRKDMEPIDIVIIVVLSIAVIGIVAYLIKKKMKGESGCGYGCSG